MIHNDEGYRKMIHSTAWLKLRRDTLSVHPMCQRCQEEGRLSPATEVHHIVPVDDGLSLEEKRRLMFDPYNLLALCHRCHVMVHTDLGRSGKPRSQRTNAEALKRFKDKFF